MSKFLFGLVAFLAWQLIPAEAALAWGPCVHLHAGNLILDSLHQLSPGLAAALDLYRGSFLYGALSADIFIGKGTRFTPTHCHNWSVGLRLLQSAPNQRLLAFAWGYMTHLAADTVAHNFYVPNIQSMTGHHGKLGHVYIEMQADRRFEAYSEQARDLLSRPHRHTNAFLREVLEKKKLSFSLKKEIYKRSIDLFNLKSWQNSLSFMDRAMPTSAPEAYLAQMADLAARLCLDLLKSPNTAIALDYDPIGSRNLRLVKSAHSTGPAALPFPADVPLARVASM